MRIQGREVDPHSPHWKDKRRPRDELLSAQRLTLVRHVMKTIVGRGESKSAVAATRAKRGHTRI